MKVDKYMLKNGKTKYKFKAHLGFDSVTGKRVQVSRSGFNSKKEAEIEYARLVYEFENKKASFSNGNILYKDLYQIWLKERYDKLGIAESSYVQLISNFKNHILPFFGDDRVGKITVRKCQDFFDSLKRKLKDYNKVYSTASRVMRYAVEENIINSNPFDRIIRPIDNKEKKQNKNFLTKEELNKLLYYAKKDENLMYFVFFRLIAYTGLRSGEARALEWNDIDFSNRKISVTKNLANGDRRLYIKTTKTTSSYRTIYVDEESLNYLKKWKDVQDKFCPSNIVFTDTNKYLEASRFSIHLNNLIKRHDLKKINVHGLRHTHCSLLYESNVPVKEAQLRLGHKNALTTLNIYTHLSNKSKENTVSKFMKYMEK